MTAAAGLAALPAPHGSLTFTVDGQRYTYTPPAVSAWLEACVYDMPGCWWQLWTAGLSDEDQTAMWERMVDPGEGWDLDDYEDVALAVLGAVVGCGFWPAWRLLGWARSAWMAFDGWAVEHGFDPLNAPVYRVVNAAYSLRVQSCEKDGDKQRLDATLFTPPEGKRLSGRYWGEEPSRDDTAALDAVESAAFMQVLSGS